MYILHAIDDWASLCVHIVLEELGQPYERRIRDFDAGDLNTPAYRALHPLGLIPALETPQGSLFETGAILLWLSEQHGAMAPAAGSAGRVAFLKWFVFVNATLHPNALFLFHPHRMAGDDAAPIVAATAHGKLLVHLAAIETMMTTERPDWLSADRPTVLAYYLAMLVRWVTSIPAYPQHAVDLSRYPALRDLMVALEVRPAVQRAARAEGLGTTPFSSPLA